MLLGIILIFVAILSGAFFVATYKVVDPNEAHVVVFMGRGRKIYAPRKNVEGIDKEAKSSYFYIPLIMKRFILPLTNVKMDIKNVELNDEKVAPFTCDVITWVRIKNPIQAGERLNLDNGRSPFDSLYQDLISLVQAVARAVAMKQEILGIMRDRKTFAKSVSLEVNGVLEKWGIELVNLEVNDIRDSENSQVIKDYERKRQIQVNSEVRKDVALKNREAIEVEQENIKLSEIAKAVAEEEFQKRQIERDKNVGIEGQEKDRIIASKEMSANYSKVEADRTLVVGQADIKREAVVKDAEGIAEAVRVKGEKEADVVKMRGEADGKAIEAKGTAEATAKDKMAEAMAKFNNAATGIEKIRAWIEVEKARWDAYSKVAQNADIKVVNSGKGADLFGVPMNAETGANLGQMLKGLDISKIGEMISGKSKKDNNK